MRIRKQNRLNSFDYSKDGSYFVTFCIKDKECYFGKIENEQLFHSDFGKIVVNSIEWLKGQYPDIRIHEYVVMPDHVHLLIEINRNISNEMVCIVGEGSDLPLQTNKIKSLSELIGALKTVSSKNIRLNGCSGFAWQRSFYDQIIKSSDHFDNVKNYIIDNPKRWCKSSVRSRPDATIVFLHQIHFHIPYTCTHLSGK